VIDAPALDEPRAAAWTPRVAQWELWVGAIGAVAAIAAVVVTLEAGYFVYPGWLALQKADLILGPIAVGLYWHRRRPASHFGFLLIGVGLLQIPNAVLEAATNPTLFTIGYYWETFVYLSALALILTFPSGRFHLFPEGLIFAVAVIIPQGVVTLTSALSSEASPGGTISACLDACPRNVLVISEDPALALRLLTWARWGTIGVASAAAALLIWRVARGSPPRRRAFAIGTPVALVFLVTQVLNQLVRLYGSPNGALLNDMRWLLVVARSLIWYGFLFALIAAELFAARVLRRMTIESLRRPTVDELEELLRRPLGDPGLRLAFWRPVADEWVDARGRAVEPPAPGSGRLLTEVDRDGRRAAAIVHDAQLADDPELLQAAGATALLALENAQLQAAWTDSLRELRDSRARIATAAEEERHNLERNLHDGAQQRLLAVRMGLRRAAEDAAGDPRLRAQLDELDGQVGDALEELRELAHGIYPSVLAEGGLVPALDEVVRRAGRLVVVTAHGVGRYPTKLEGAVYYCCREALQNAIKHSGQTSAISIDLRDDGRDLRFEVRDNGVGFDEDGGAGTGLRNMQDRVAALDGSLEVTSTQGHGTLVAGTLPLDATSAGSAEAAMKRHWSSLP
jgi:signal transduction histidine kinase